MPTGVDATASVPGDIDATAVVPPDLDATHIVNGSFQGDAGQTTYLPPSTTRTGVLPTGAAMARWTPGVAARDVAARDAAGDTAEGEEPDSSDDQAWPMNAAAVAAALLLFAVLGIGLWLILHAMRPSASPAAQPSQTVEPSAGQPSTGEIPTSVPSASMTSMSPEFTASSNVTIPDVRGRDQTSAVLLLHSSGLSVFIEYRVDASVQGGTALGTEPAAGLSVAAGSTVTLIVARAPSPSPTQTGKPPLPSPSVSPSTGPT